MTRKEQFGFPTRVFIHSDNIRSNLALLQSLAGKAAMFPAVKADAYGHGALEVARICLESGYNNLCVAHLAEAVELIRAGLQAQYLVMTPFLPEYAEDIVHYSCQPVVCTLDQIARLSAAAQKLDKTVKIHLKVDTGMGRVGIKSEEVTQFLETITAAPGVKLEGIMSHYPRGDEEDSDYSQRQTERFEQIRRQTKNYSIPYYHIANSAALVRYPASRFDVVRPGVALYGLNPFGMKHHSALENLKPALEWKTRIVFIKEVPEGAGLSYGHTFITPRRMLIATLPVGYGDGLRRILSNTMDVLINGQRCPQVGRICMDQALVDVTALEDKVQVGDEAVLIGNQGARQISAEEMAEQAQTINYEITTGITSRVPRVYL